MDVGINNIIYMELYSGQKMANGTRRKMIVTGTIGRGSTVFIHLCPYVVVVHVSLTLRSTDKPQSSAHLVFNN